MTVPVAPVLRGYHLDSGTCRLFWRDVPGATSYNLYRGVPGTPPSRNEKQTVTIDATGGTFKLTYSAQQTAAIAFDATAAQVKSALVALSNIGPDDVDVTNVGS